MVHGRVCHARCEPTGRPLDNEARARIPLARNANTSGFSQHSCYIISFARAAKVAALNSHRPKVASCPSIGRVSNRPELHSRVAQLTPSTARITERLRFRRSKGDSESPLNSA